MKRYVDLVNERLNEVEELMPWDLEERLKAGSDVFLIDVYEPYEYEAMHMEGSINVPRGILEPACEYDYEETVPELVEAREMEVGVLCRSGNRSVLAAYNMHQMGYQIVKALRTGLRGWSDYEQPLVDKEGWPVSIDTADDYFNTRVRPEQLDPTRRQ